jgi:cytochrome c-type biogenesis protein CcmH
LTAGGWTERFAVAARGAARAFGLRSRRQQSQAIARTSRSRAALWALAGGVLAVALAGGAIHLLKGRSPAGPSTSPLAGGEPASATLAPGLPDKPVHSLSDEQLQRMVDQATARVKKNPVDATAWAMLAHSYDMLGKFAESIKAYAELTRLLPGDAQVLADYADAAAVANGRTMKGEPTMLVEKALAIDGENVKALTLAGTAAYERKEYGEAVKHWEHARRVSTDAVFRQQIEASIASARAAARGETAVAVAPAAAAVPASNSASGAAFVSGTVMLADQLAAKVSPDSTVFIFARTVSGSRMPVALVRRKVRDLPLDFVLDDAAAMVRDVKLSQVSTVVIGARISERGDVLPQPGDMQGWSAPVSVGTRGVKVEISEVLK